MEITRKKKESQRKEKEKSDGAGDRKREKETGRQTEKLYGEKYVWFIIPWYPDNWYKVKDNRILEQLEEALIDWRKEG
ncbi:hypothetical protein RRG08_058356 [Elysia crispata]|uniref:Uncharacterized protein n=1 Tax=Elysia crispata TaxID=231223 RepID=A0AAE1CNK8_9GAST|nr:hypothetical protein RRG08_058356 [Elysia crispata]